jgi:hypothetical protein
VTELEVLRRLQSQNEPLLQGVRSQSFQVVGHRKYALPNYYVNNYSTIRSTGPH